MPWPSAQVSEGSPNCWALPQARINELQEAVRAEEAAVAALKKGALRVAGSLCALRGGGTLFYEIPAMQRMVGGVSQGIAAARRPCSARPSAEVAEANSTLSVEQLQVAVAELEKRQAAQVRRWWMRGWISQPMALVTAASPAKPGAIVWPCCASLLLPPPCAGGQAGRAAIGGRAPHLRGRRGQSGEGGVAHQPGCGRSLGCSDAVASTHTSPCCCRCARPSSDSGCPAHNPACPFPYSITGVHAHV